MHIHALEGMPVTRRRISPHRTTRNCVGVDYLFYSGKLRPFIILIRFLCVYILYYLIYCADVIVKSVQKDLNEDV